jgi:hypothetical protein
LVGVQREAPLVAKRLFCLRTGATKNEIRKILASFLGGAAHQLFLL